MTGSPLRLRELGPDDVDRLVLEELRPHGVVSVAVGRFRDGVVAPAAGGLTVGMLLRPGDGVAGRAISSGRTVVVERYEEWPDRRNPDVTGGVFAVPFGPDSASTGCIVGMTGPDGVPPAAVAAAEELAPHLWDLLVATDLLRAGDPVQERAAVFEAVRGDVLGNLHHELRTPISVMAGVVQTLRTAVEAGDVGLTTQLLDAADRSVERLRRRIQRVEALVTVAEDGYDRRRRAVPVVGVVERVAARSALAVDRAPSLCPGGCATLAGRPVTLEHALEELLHNAATHGEGVPVVGCGRDGDTLEVVVRNAGALGTAVGAATGALVRGGATPTTRPTSGLGLGLAFVERAVVAVGGRFELAESDGEVVARLLFPAEEHLAACPGSPTGG